MNQLKKLILNGNTYIVTDESAVAFDESQSLSDTQKEQARKNIGAVGTNDVTPYYIQVDQYDDGHYEIGSDFEWETMVEHARKTSANVVCRVVPATGGDEFLEYHLQRLSVNIDEAVFVTAEGSSVYTMIIGKSGSVEVFVKNIRDQAVCYTAQSPTDDEKSQARQNIGAAGAAEVEAQLSQLDSKLSSTLVTAKFKISGGEWSLLTCLTHTSQQLETLLKNGVPVIAHINGGSFGKYRTAFCWIEGRYICVGCSIADGGWQHDPDDANHYRNYNKNDKSIGNELWTEY